MTTKTIQFLFNLSGTPTDVTSVVFRDPSATFGIRRTDTLAVIVAAGTALVHPATGTYTYTFTEPAANLNYEYWLEYIYNGNTERIRQVLETTQGTTTIPLAPTTYAQMGIDTVACGDAVLAAYLATQADIIWAIQARRGVALDLWYQYYVQDLLNLAMEHTRMRIDTNTGASAMTARGTMDGLNNSSANSSSTKTRNSSFSELSASAQSSSRAADRSSSASSRLDASNSANRDSSSYDYSTMSQSANGSSSRTQSGSSLSKGTLENDGTSGKANSNSVNGTYNESKYKIEGTAFVPSSATGVIPEGEPLGNGATTLTSAYIASSASALGIGLSGMEGNSGVSNQVKILTGGLVNSEGIIENATDPTLYTSITKSDSSHARSTVGSQIGSGTSTFSSSGTRANNRAGTSSATSTSTSLGNSSSTMTTSSTESSVRTASSSSHSESDYHSSMTANSTSHNESAAADTMTATGNNDTEYYSQIFESLKQMWEDTLEAIRRLEAQMMLTQRYLAGKMITVAPNTTLIGAASLAALPTLTQRPGVYGGVLRTPFDPWVIR